MRLPFPPDFDPNLHTLVDILCPTLVIDPELEQIAVLEFVCSAFRVRGAEADVVEERPGAALRVLDIELAACLDPDFRVRAAHDFALESELVGSESVRCGDAEPGAVGESPNA